MHRRHAIFRPLPGSRHFKLESMILQSVTVLVFLAWMVSQADEQQVEASSAARRCEPTPPDPKGAPSCTLFSILIVILFLSLMWISLESLLYGAVFYFTALTSLKRPAWSDGKNQTALQPGVHAVRRFWGKNTMPRVWELVSRSKNFFLYCLVVVYDT